MTQLRSVTCHMGSHSVTYHPTQVNTPRLNPSQTGRSRFTYPWGMEGWVEVNPNHALKCVYDRLVISSKFGPILHRSSPDSDVLTENNNFAQNRV